MLEKYGEPVLQFLQTQHAGSAWKRSEDAFLRFLERLPAIPSVGRGYVSEGLFSPSLIIVAFVVFLGLSDHALSLPGLLGIAAGLSSYFLGTRVRGIGLPRVSEKYFWPLLGATLLSFAALLYDWSTYQKYTYIPVLLLFLTGAHTRRLALLFILGWGFLFKMGWWAVSAPYLLFALFFWAREGSSDFLISRTDSIFFALFCAGAFFFALDIGLVILQTGTLPLASERARNALDPTFTMGSHLLPLSCVLLATTRRRSATLLVSSFSLAAMLVLAFRTQVIFLFLAVVIASSRARIISALETYACLGLAAIFGLALTGLRSLLLNTSISLLDAIRLRVGLSLDIYDMMVSLGGLSGYTKGQVAISALPGFARLMPNIAWAPRRMVAEFVGMQGSATSTLLGPLALDFGIAGIVLAMFFLGYLLGRLHEDSAQGGLYSMLYASCLAYALLGIETGLVDLEVLALFGVSFLIIQMRMRQRQPQSPQTTCR